MYRLAYKTKLSFLTLLVLLASACQHAAAVTWSTEAFRKELTAYEGQSIDRVVDQYGFAQRDFKAPNGNPVYEYQFYNSVHTPLQATTFHEFGMSSSTIVTGGETYVYSCTVWFETAAQKVLKARWRGNACKAPD